MSQVTVTLPDGSSRNVPAGTPVRDVAEGISPRLAQAALAGVVDGKLVDLSFPLDRDASVRIVTDKSPEALALYRHSTAHLLAAAVTNLFPGVQCGIGPATEDGFFYDFVVPRPFVPEDLDAIEKKMKELASQDLVYERQSWPRDEATSFFAKRGEALKVQLIEEKTEGQKEVSCYTIKDRETFVDFCVGPHVPSTGKLKAFKLLTTSNAYWKGDARNQPMQRVYGTAFFSDKDLKAYLTQIEEAKKRDHRKLGRELELFVFDDDVGPGLPMFLPRGAVIAEELEKLAKETEFAAGYQRVLTPHIARESLYLKSGHLPYYAESMFPPLELKLDLADEHRIAALEATIDEKQKQIAAFERIFTGLEMEEAARDHRETFERLESSRRELTAHTLKRNEMLARSRYYLKAMNCPHHHKLFGSLPRSYRDLPLRLAEYGTCYRYEKSGELFGLMRGRLLHMNDAHLYMTPEQFEDEFNAVNEMYLNYFKLFGIEKYLMRFSTHDPSKLGQKFVDEPELWKQTEEMTRNVLKDSDIDYVEVPNEAAFYGPKIDVQVWSVIGREFTLATNQVDFAQPRSFDLRYKDRDNTERIPICIHRAPLGTHERFIGFLIEHYAGNFPLWLAPEQVRILTIGDDAKLLDYARSVLKELRAHQVRAEIDESPDKINGKIQRAEQMKVHTMFVIGKRDMEANAISVRVHGKGNLGAKPRDEVIAEILSSIKERQS